MKIVYAIFIISLISVKAGFSENTVSVESEDILADILKIVKVPTILDFTAFKCKSCKIMEKRLKTIAKEFKEKADVKFVDVNKEKKLVKQYKINLIPTLVFLNKDGKEVFRKTGLMEETVIKAKLNELVGGTNE